MALRRLFLLFGWSPLQRGTDSNSHPDPHRITGEDKENGANGGASTDPVSVPVY